MMMFSEMVPCGKTHSPLPSASWSTCCAAASKGSEVADGFSEAGDACTLYPTMQCSVELDQLESYSCVTSPKSKVGPCSSTVRRLDTYLVQTSVAEFGQFRRRRWI